MASAPPSSPIQNPNAINKMWSRINPEWRGAWFVGSILVAAILILVVVCLAWSTLREVHFVDWVAVIPAATLGIGGIILSLQTNKHWWFLFAVVFTLLAVVGSMYQLGASRRDARSDAIAANKRFDDLKKDVTDAIDSRLKNLGDAKPQTEAARRKAILETLRDEYIAKQPASIKIIARETWPPTEWINKRLGEMNEAFRVAGEPGKEGVVRITELASQVEQLKTDVKKVQEATAPLQVHSHFNLVRDGIVNADGRAARAVIDVWFDEPVPNPKYFVLCDRPCKGVGLEQTVAAVSFGTTYGKLPDEAKLAVFMPRFSVPIIPSGEVVRLEVESEDQQPFHVIRAGRIKLTQYGDK